MEIPKTWKEFEEGYGFTDRKEIYTNGSRLIQSFRVEQWLDSQKILSMDKELRTIFIFALRYALPRHTYAFDIVSKYILQELDNFEDWELRGMLDDCRLFYPDPEFGGDTCDQPAVDRFRNILVEELEKRNKRGE